jgi:hypothetical protein
MEQKIQCALLYYLIVVREGVGDECAHAQLLADIVRLRYRDTFLTMSSETTRALPQTESWVASWLEFLSRSALSFFSTSGTNTGEQLARGD